MLTLENYQDMDLDVGWIQNFLVLYDSLTSRAYRLPPDGTVSQTTLHVVWMDRRAILGTDSPRPGEDGQKVN